MSNPYAQVALTYVRRPFSSSLGWLMSAIIPLMFVLGTKQLADIERSGSAPVILQLMPFMFLFMFSVLHIKEQFADARAHLTPGFRRVHIAIATAVTIVLAVFIPAVLTMCSGLQSVGLTALVVFLFGTSLWVMLVKSSSYLGIAFAVGWVAMITAPGQGCLKEIILGHFELQAIGLLIVGILITLLGGIRLFRLNEDMPAYHTPTSNRWAWSGRNSMNRQAWSGEGRIFPWFWDWIAERQIVRLTRHARRASDSRWSRICRWQVGMVSGWSLWLAILGAAILVCILTWWMQTDGSQSSYGLVGMTSFFLTAIPVSIAIVAFTRRAPMRGNELLMPVDRKTYVRQLGIASALRLLQLWGSMCIVCVLFWLLTIPKPLPAAMLASVVALSAVFQIAAFAIAFWIARYRSYVLNVFSIMFLVMAVHIFCIGFFRFPRPSDQMSIEIAWPVGVMTLLGLLITYDAYRRWLKADFD